MTLQAPQHLLMIRPAAFGSNSETLASNAFQQTLNMSKEQVQELAVHEFDRLVALLNANAIRTVVIDDTENPEKPDAIFPNNWVSMQPDGKLVTYPMLATNRRLERREDILETIKQKFLVKETLDFSHFERKGEIVEGTGSLIFDHVNRLAYAARSPRTVEALVREICAKLGYEAIVFNATDEDGIPIYHTNVMMTIATEIAVVCLDAVKDDRDQEIMLESFARTGHKVIAISFEQMKSFAGNALEVMKGNGERVLIISETAIRSLLPGQLDAITKFVDILPVSIPIIEKYSGGSVRCMLAGIHLEEKK